MISILIPTRDYDCHMLVKELHKQGEELGVPYEILVGEDGSSQEGISLNAIADSLSNCRRLISTKNIGRAGIRNLLAENARYDSLIFIDSDAIVEKRDFLKQYIIALQNNDVVCGGLYHADTMPNDGCSLRFKYEKNADKYRCAELRNKAPYDKFSTFNFAIRKELFKSILFDIRITQYGHEDTLFGKELEIRKAKILHIDNKLLHNGLESNLIYLSKVEKSIESLICIKDIIGTTPLLKAASKLESWHAKQLYLLFWKIFRKNMRKNLTGNNPSLKILELYKLGYYCNFCK